MNEGENEIDFSSDTVAEAHDRGRDAYFCSNRTTLSDNPYPLGMPQRDAWRNGFEQANCEDAE